MCIKIQNLFKISRPNNFQISRPDAITSRALVKIYKLVQQNYPAFSKNISTHCDMWLTAREVSVISALSTIWKLFSFKMGPAVLLFLIVLFKFFHDHYKGCLVAFLWIIPIKLDIKHLEWGLLLRPEVLTWSIETFQQK